jgi:hypothetical protein
MLAHFEHLDLAPLLEDLNVGHVLLLDLLDGYFLPCLQMRRHFDKAELTFAKRFFKFVEIKHVAVIHNFLQLVDPVLLLLRRLEEEDVNLVGRDANRNRIVQLLGLRARLSRCVIIPSFNEA